MTKLLLTFLLALSSHADSTWEEREATPLRGEYSFQDGDLASFIAANPRAAILVWSPHVPSSVTGMAAFLSAAKSLSLPTLILMDPQADESLAKKVVEVNHWPPEVLLRLRSLSLIQHGAMLDYPTALVIRDGKVSGDAISGDRGGGYLSLLRRRLAVGGGKIRLILNARPAPVQVRGIMPLPAADFAYETKPVSGSRWVSGMDGQGRGIFFDFDDSRLADTLTGQVVLTTGDQHYSLFPGALSGLELMESSELLRRAVDPVYYPAQLFLDGGFNARELSVGILHSGAQRSQYRVLSASPGFAPQLRDYTITHRSGTRPPAVTGRSKPGPACKNYEPSGFGQPTISNDGRFVITNTDFPVRATLVYELSPRDPAACTVKATIDAPTSRASFSPDGSRIAFSAGSGGSFIYEVASKQLLELEGLDAVFGPGTPLAPEFESDGSLLLPYLKDGGGILLVDLGI